MTELPTTVFGVEVADAEALLTVLNAHRGELNERMAIELTEASQDRVGGSMPVLGNRQPFGLLHGGASAVLAETLGSTHAAIRAPAGTQAVGIELSCSHHRSATGGRVHGISGPLQVGRTLATFEIVVRDDAGRRVCTARLTCLFRPTRPAGK